MKINCILYSLPLLLLSGAAQADTSESAQALIANPAAVFCEEEGGTYKTVEEEAGSRGVCVLADGDEVDAWEYFRATAENSAQN